MARALGAVGQGTFQAGSANSIASGTFNLTAGNLAFVAVRYSHGGNTITGISDTAGNTYTLIESLAPSSTRMACWYCQNCLGDASNIVTVTFSASVGARVCHAIQFSGAEEDGITASAQGSVGTGSPISDSGIYYLENGLVISPVQVDATGGTWTAGSGFTSAVQDSSTVMMIQYQIVTTSTTVDVAASNSNTSSKLISSALFLIAGGLGGSPSPPPESSGGVSRNRFQRRM